jgi:transposase
VNLARRKFTREFKLGAIRALESGKSVGVVARTLQVHPMVLNRWRAEYRSNPTEAFRGQGNKATESREATLERKVAQLLLENDFLKKTLAHLEERRLMESDYGKKGSTKRSRKK